MGQRNPRAVLRAARSPLHGRHGDLGCALTPPDEVSMAKEAPATRDQFRHFRSISTRWKDNDVYGHVNNVVYYSFFDTAVNQYLVEEGGLDFDRGESFGVVAETMCRFHRSL